MRGNASMSWFLLLRAYWFLTYTSVIKDEVCEGFWQCISLTDNVARHCESCQPECIYCWPAVMTLTHTQAGLCFNSCCCTPCQPFRMVFQAMCVFGGVGSEALYVGMCICVHASIHVKCLLARHSPHTSADHSSSGKPLLAFIKPYRKVGNN